jgi:hypothetical protein
VVGKEIAVKKYVVRPQPPHDRDQPFASMQRLSNSLRFVSATGASIPAEATGLDASN